MTFKGTMIAASVAGLFATAMPAIAGEKGASKVNCAGINDCKGKSSCHSAANDCKGQNGCKGKGMTPTASAKECTDKGGTVAMAKK